jgi:hypothetical protein
VTQWGECEVGKGDAGSGLTFPSAPEKASAMVTQRSAWDRPHYIPVARSRHANPPPQNLIQVRSSSSSYPTSTLNFASGNDAPRFLRCTTTCTNNSFLISNPEISQKSPPREKKPKTDIALTDPGKKNPPSEKRRSSCARARSRGPVAAHNL